MTFKWIARWPRGNPDWLTLDELSSPHGTVLRYHTYGWGRGGTYASTSARGRLGRDSIRQPCHHFKPCRQFQLCRRPELGGREPVPVLQADQVVRAARGGVQRGARP